jgi:hypothetical protein
MADTVGNDERTHSKEVLRRRQRDATRGRLWDCAPLTNRFPPLTRKRAMTAERYGPTLPTGQYPVVKHALAPASICSGNRYPLSADCHKGMSGSEYMTGVKTITFGISRGERRRPLTDYCSPGACRNGPGPAVAGTRAARGAAPEAQRRPGGCGQPWPPGRPHGDDTRPRVRESGLEDPFLSGPTEVSADRCVLTQKAWRPILGGGVQSHMGYHGDGGRRVAMQCQLAFHAIARNNSATVRKSGRPHA